MEFLKKNYEKILLAVVLAGLTLAACLLPFVITGKRAALEDKRVRNKAKVQPLAALVMTNEEAALQRAQSPLHLDYTTQHNLFNPVVWKRINGVLMKEQTGREEGPDALVVTATHSLYFEIRYESTNGTGYQLDIERQALLREDKRTAHALVSKDSQNGLVSLKEIKGPPERPTEMTVEWRETGELITFTPDKPYRKIDGYSADLKYPLEPNKVWTNQRVGSKALNFANGRYNIVAITESNVVVSAESNKKKTTIPFHSATEPR